MSVADYLQEGLPKKKSPPGIPVRNKFQLLDRDRSESSSRSVLQNSLKRRRIDEEETENSDEEEEAEVTIVDPNQAFKSMANEEGSFLKIKEIIETIKMTLEGAKEEDISAPMRTVVGKLVEYMELTTGMQKTTASVVVDSVAKLASPRMSRKERMMEKRQSEKYQEDPEKVEKDNRKKKFMNEVREAERSLLIFNTDMGKVPIMNPETMRKRFTAAVVSKAATVEERSDGRPTAEVVSQLDDTLSMITKMEYFGKVTKKATRFNDRRQKVEADYYTILVKVSFKDKTTKEAAESRLRAMCKMGGSVPYHRTLRNAINRIIEDCKQKYKGDFIQARLIADKMQVKVSRRDADRVWHDNVETVDLPDTVLDTSREAGRPTRASKSRDPDLEMEGEESQG